MELTCLEARTDLVDALALLNVMILHMLCPGVGDLFSHLQWHGFHLNGSKEGPALSIGNLGLYLGF